MTLEPSITALLFDTDGTLYHRPRRDRHLRAFLGEHGLIPRSPAAVQRTLRAARFDVHTGRIPRDVFYDALLRFHGVNDRALLPEGREALLRDAADIELYPGVLETLAELESAGYRLGTLSDSPHPKRDKLGWLALRRLSPGLWAAFVTSLDLHTTTADPALFERALSQLGSDPARTAYIGHESFALACAAELGLVTVAFLPDDFAVETDYRIGSLFELPTLFLSLQRA